MIQALKRLIEGVIAFFQGRGGGSADERRRLIRVRCEYAVQCDIDENRYPATVVDIGLNGMRLVIEEKLRKGLTVLVHQPDSAHGLDTESVVCKVRWARRRRNHPDYEVGLQYDDEIKGNLRRSWVKFLLKELGFDERSIFTRRKSIRADSHLPCHLRVEDGRQVRGTINNLGVGGALFEGPGAYSPGTQVRLKIGPFKRFKVLDVVGTVISSHKDHVSIRFADLSATQVRMLGDYVIQLLRDATQ